MGEEDSMGINVYLKMIVSGKSRDGNGVGLRWVWLISRLVPPIEIKTQDPSHPVSCTGLPHPVLHPKPNGFNPSTHLHHCFWVVDICSLRSAKTRKKSLKSRETKKINKKCGKKRYFSPPPSKRQIGKNIRK